MQYAILKARTRKDPTRVQNPGTSTHLTDAMKAGDGSVSACDYDVAKLRESKLQFMMSAMVVGLIHWKWSVTQPLLMICAL